MPGFLISAPGADESIRPTKFEKILETGILRAVLFFKLH
jgi:hypothetical protein